MRRPDNQNKSSCELGYINERFGCAKLHAARDAKAELYQQSGIGVRSGATTPPLLAHNSLGERGGGAALLALEKALEQPLPASLERVSLSGNGFTSSARKRLAAALASGPNLGLSLGLAPSGLSAHPLSTSLDQRPPSNSEPHPTLLLSEASAAQLPAVAGADPGADARGPPPNQGLAIAWDAAAKLRGDVHTGAEAVR